MATGIRIRFRRDTKANWDAVDPILEEGELGYVTDLGQFKIGNGVTPWISLGYFTPGTSDGSIAPDSDWILNNAVGGTGTVDSDWVLRQISAPENALIDSDWVLRQVVAGSVDSDELTTALDTIVSNNLANAIVDSEYVRLRIAEIDISGDVDSDWVLRQVVLNSLDSDNLNTTLNNLITLRVNNAYVDSDYVQRKIDALEIGTDSDWVLRQIKDPNGIDSDWVLAQVGDPDSYFYQTLLSTLQADSEDPIGAISGIDSDWIGSNFVSNSNHDSDLQKFVDADSDLNKRIDSIISGSIEIAGTDSDWILRNFPNNADHDSDLAAIGYRIGILESDYVDSEEIFRRVDEKIAKLVDSDYVLSVIVDSEWVLRQIADPVDPLIDSEWVVSTAITQPGNVVYVDVLGGDSDIWRGSAARPFRTLEKAVNVPQGFTVMIGNGTWGYPLEIVQRNTSYIGYASVGGSGNYTKIASINSEKTGIKMANLRIVGRAEFNNTDSDSELQTIGNHYNQMLFSGESVFNGVGFHEFRNTIFGDNVEMSDNGNKLIYSSRFEGSLNIFSDSETLTTMNDVVANNINVQGV